MVDAEFMYFSSLEDKNLIFASRRTFGSLRRFGRFIMLYLKCLYLNTSALTITFLYILMSKNSHG